MESTLTTRIPKEIEKDLQFFTKVEKIDRSALTRKLLEEALRERKIDYALKKYQNKEISLWKAARIGTVPLSRLLSILKEKRIPFNYSEKDFEEDMKAADKYSKK